MNETELPTPGVSAVSGSGDPTGTAERVTVPTAESRRGTQKVEPARPLAPRSTKAEPKKPRVRRPGEDVLRPELLSGLKSTATGDVVSAKIAVGSKGNKNVARYRSANGELLSFKIPRNVETRKRVLPQVLPLLAIREIALGGDPRTVFEAFGFKMKDLDGTAIYPIPGNGGKPLLSSFLDADVEEGEGGLSDYLED